MTNRSQACTQLKIALFHGRIDRARALLAETPDLADGMFGLECALYRRDAVASALRADPGLAVKTNGPRRPLLHLAFSKWFQAHPELEDDMLAVAELLVAHGADVNDGFAFGDTDHMLSALYGAIGHGGNMALGRWLLERGADPNDGESLYHATELGHTEGLRLLLAAGARPEGTNALLRALDFNAHDAVALLLAHGADPNEYNTAAVGGEAPWVIPALHQAARRGCDRRMADMLLDAGADPAAPFQGMHPYAFARVYGSAAVAGALAERGATCALSDAETLMAQAADGTVPSGAALDPEAVPDPCRHILREILSLPGRGAHLERLMALGLPHDAPDREGLTPVQVAGWEGLPDMMTLFLRRKPDLTHVNGYGGTLLATILHGSENCPARAHRDHVACLRLALEHGAAVSAQDIESAGRDDLRGVLLEVL